MPRRPPPSAGHGDTWSYSSFPRGVSEQFVHGMVVQVSRKRLGPAKPPLASTFKTRFAARKVASKNQILSEAKDLARCFGARSLPDPSVATLPRDDNARPRPPVVIPFVRPRCPARPFSFLSFVHDAPLARSHSLRSSTMPNPPVLISSLRPR